MHKEFEESFATDPVVIHLYRTGHAYTACTLLHVVLVRARAGAPGTGHHRGGDTKAVRRLGFSPASSLADALEIAF